MTLRRSPVAEEFSWARTIRYAEFVKRSTASGVIAYWSFLTGVKVLCFGRKGEVHVEEFPRAKP
jgi:hypothetical protein